MHRRSKVHDRWCRCTVLLYVRDGNGDMAADWWLQTDDSISALGFVWLAHLFNRHGLLDHDWMIGRSNQEPWALVSEPCKHDSALAAVAPLRRELEQVGTELIEYPSAQATHSPGDVQMLVANVVDIHALAKAVARQIIAFGSKR
jgi:hypothetical protein